MRTLIAYLMLSCAAFAGAPPSEPYTREVKVPGAGWYRVPVDGHIWRYARGRVLAFDEQGKALPCGILAVEVTLPNADEAQPRLAKVEEEGDKLVLYLQVDKLAGKHDQLSLELEDREYIPWMELWGSKDGNKWEAMAKRTLFRLGSGERMQGNVLVYPPCDFRHLKLIIPKEKESPQTVVRESRIRNLWVQYAAAGTITPWIEEPVEVKAADPALANSLSEKGETLFQLDLPDGSSPSAYGIELPLERLHPPMAVSLLTMERGVPQVNYSCTLLPEFLLIPVSQLSLHAPVFLRIGREHAAFERVIVRRSREEVVLFADHAGPVTLAYGGCEVHPEGSPPVQRPLESKEAELGSVVRHPLSLSTQLARLVRRISRTSDIQLQWDLEFPQGVLPGQWVSVELTPEMKRAAHETSGGDWGIMSDGHLIPALGKADPMPLLGKAERIALVSDPAAPERSAGEMVWGQAVFPAVWWSIKAHDLGEPVSILVEAFKNPSELQGMPGDPPSSSWAAIGQSTIECGPWSSDCMALMEYTGPTPEKVRITAVGHTLPPPASIDVSVWRLRHRLFFPVPEGKKVQLVVGPAVQDAWETLRPHIAPDRLSGDLPAVGMGPLMERSQPKRSWDRVLFIAGLILAVAVLLYLIVKLLPKKETA